MGIDNIIGINNIIDLQLIFIFFFAVPNNDDEQIELYRTFSSLTDKAQMISSQLEFLKKQQQNIESLKEKDLETLCVFFVVPIRS